MPTVALKFGFVAVAGGTVDAITATYAPVPPSLYNGLLLFFFASGANTSTTPTFAPNGLTARTIVKKGGQALAVGDIPAARALVGVCYDLTNTRWELINPSSASVTGSFAADDFTTNGAGTSPALTDEYSGSTFVALGVTKVDVWLNQSGEQGVKIPSADYTYNPLTGIISTGVGQIGLEASKNYTAYGR